MKYLSYEGLQYLYSKILTRLGLKVDASGGDISSTKISAFDTVSTEFPVPAAGENTKTVFGKIKKFITDFNSLKSSLLLLSMLTSQYENNTSKIPTAALVYALKQSLDATNSNLNNKADKSDLQKISGLYIRDSSYVNNFALPGFETFVIDSTTATSVALPGSSWWYVEHHGSVDGAGYAHQIFYEYGGTGTVCRRWASASAWVGRSW